MHASKNKVYTESSAPPSQIEELYQHLRSFRRFPKGYRAVYLHFSVLDRLHQQPHHRRAIATAFNKLIAPYEGKLFWMQNFDLCFICKACPAAALEQAKFEAFRAIEDSPVLKRIIENGDDDQICDWYDLGQAYDDFTAVVTRLRRVFASNDGDTEEAATPTLNSLMATLGGDKSPRAKVSPPKKKAKKKVTTKPQYDHIFPQAVTPKIGPLELDKLERNIKTMDVINLIAQQNICAVVENVPPEVIFTKKYISLDEVNKSILPGYDISGDKWLFQRLTESFDHKLMQALIQYDSFPDGVLSININVATVNSKDFDDFIAKKKSSSDTPLVLEFTLFDIMSDLTAYYQAQEKVTRHGCKICICKMDVQSIAILDRQLINVDFLKIRWQKNYLSALNADERMRIKAAIKTQGKMRVVLSDCDSDQAIKFGHSLGIVLFQGFEVDKLQSMG